MPLRNPAPTDPTLDPQVVRRARLLGLATAGFASALAVVAVAGWALGWPGFHGPFFAGLPVPANSALAIVLGGAALALRSPADASAGRRRAGQLLAAAVMALAAWAVWDRVQSLAVGPASQAHFHYMHPFSQAAFLALGLALLGLDADWRRRHYPAELAALAALALMAFPLTLEAFGLPALNGIRSDRITSPAALGIVLLSVAVLLVRPTRGVTAALCSARAGGMMARRLLPFVVLLLIAAGWADVQIGRWLPQAPGAGPVLLTTTLLIVLGSVLWLSAVRLNEVDEAARRGNREFRTIFEMANSGKAEICAATGRFLRVNRRLCGLTGYSAEELEQMTEPQLLHPEDRAAQQALAARIVAGQTREWTVEHRYMRKDGSVVWVQSTGNVLPPEPGWPWRTVAVIQDITARRRAEQELRESEAKFRTLTETAQAAIAIVQGNRYVYVNPYFAQLSGYSREELLAMENGGLVVHPEHRQMVLDYAARRQRREPAPAVYELKILTKSGVTRWLEMAPARIDYHGQPASLGIAYDITRRKRAEQALRARAEQLRVAIEAGELGTWYWLIPEDQVLGSERSAALLGLTYGVRPSYTQFLQFVHPDDRPRLYAAAARIVARHGPREPYEVEFRVIWPDGSIHWLAAQGRVFYAPDGGPVRADGVLADIGARKRGEEEMRRFQGLLERQVHERTALAEHRATQLRALTGELMQTEQRERRHLAQILHDHLQQMLVAAKMHAGMVRSRADADLRPPLQLVEDLLGQSIDASRTLTVELSPPALRDRGLVPALHWLSRQMREKHGLHVEVHADDGIDPVAEGVRDFLFQATRELLFNVVKHAGVSRAQVLVSAPGQTELGVEVVDDGRGFDPAALTTPEAQEHFGLLSVRQRFELLSGRVEVQSAPGRGTRVRMVVPLRPPAAPPADAPGSAMAGQLAAARAAPADLPPAPAGQTGVSRTRILLADDHKIVRDGLATLLGEQADLTVVAQAEDGQRAVELARQVRPDVVVMDVSMPRLDGVEATRRIHREFPDVIVVGLSMHERQDVAEALHEAGAAAYLAKDSAAEALIATIRQCRAPAA